jgi:hypothetical protein
VTPNLEGAGVKSQPPTLQATKATNIRNPWNWFGCGAILGSVCHDKMQTGSGNIVSMSRLLLFRGAVMVDEMLPANFVFAKVDAGEFMCSRCGEVRKWTPTPETLRYYTDPHHSKKRHRNL